MQIAKSRVYSFYATNISSFYISATNSDIHEIIIVLNGILLCKMLRLTLNIIFRARGFTKNADVKLFLYLPRTTFLYFFLFVVLSCFDQD